MNGLECYWAFCLTAKGAILACKSYGPGRYTEMAEAGYSKLNQPGIVMSVECVRSGQEPVVEWWKKNGPNIGGIFPKKR